AEFMPGDDEQLAPAVREALLDDLNTPQVIAALHELDRKGDFASLGPALRALGFSTSGRDTIRVPPEMEAKVSSLIAVRTAARTAKNWGESDRIRDELAAMGIALKDNKDGTTTWEVAR
ncbi:MAG: DALR domain-containing protein, partial [Microvirga sp.]